MQAVQQLFTEKYRPQNLDELILPERVMNKFKDGLVHILKKVWVTILKNISVYTKKHLVTLIFFYLMIKVISMVGLMAKMKHSIRMMKRLRSLTYLTLFDLW